LPNSLAGCTANLEFEFRLTHDKTRRIAANVAKLPGAVAEAAKKDEAAD
jgi:hypothetical protein